MVNMAARERAGSMFQGFTQSTAAAKDAIKFSESTTQAGSPDTADVFIVQTTSGTCGSALVSPIILLFGTNSSVTPPTPLAVNVVPFNATVNNLNGLTVGSEDVGISGSGFTNYRLPAVM